MLMERARPEDRAAVAVTAAYYDAGHFASRVQCECRVLIGFADEACPPPSVYAAYNELRGPKTILHDVGVPTATLRVIFKTKPGFWNFRLRQHPRK